MSFCLKINPVEVSEKYNIKLNPEQGTTKFNYKDTLSKTTQILNVKSSNPYLLCMWCSQSTFNPIGLPIEYNSSRKIVEQLSLNTGETFCMNEENEYQPSFRTYGMFCCLNCAKAFWIEFKHKPEFELSGLYLQQIWDIEFGANCAFEPSPPREMLKVFGGTIDYDDFFKAKGTYEKIVLSESKFAFEQIKANSINK